MKGCAASLKILNENQLKLIACVSMAIDHIGYFLFPKLTVLRWVGRLAFPVFAYFIAEGCYYTRNIWRYFGQVTVLGVICLIVTALSDGQIYGNILITFGCSIFIVAMLKLNPLIGAFSCGPVLWLCMQIEIDYGFVGILIPVGCWIARRAAEQIVREEAEKAGFGCAGTAEQADAAAAVSESSAATANRPADVPAAEDSLQIYGAANPQNGRTAELGVMAAGLLILAFQLAPYQWMGLFSLLLLMLYNGHRGEMHLKWFFYLFYPVHIVAIQIVGMLL